MLSQPSPFPSLHKGGEVYYPKYRNCRRKRMKYSEFLKALQTRQIDPGQDYELGISDGRELTMRGTITLLKHHERRML